MGWYRVLGIAVLAVALLATALGVAEPSTATAEPSSAAAAAQVVIPVPGRIEAEDYSGFSDTDAGNQGRAASFVDDVDVWPLIGGGYIIGRVRPGEHTSYDISVAETGRYEFVLRNASGGTGGTATVSVDGEPIAAATALGNTNGWWRFRSAVLGEAHLERGNHTLRIDWGPGQSNLDYLDVDLVSGVSGSTNKSAVTVPGVVEAEDYVSYRDTTVGNHGAATEFTDDVDVWGLPAGSIGFKLGGVHEGEFTTYDIDVAEAGTFNFALVHASPGPGGTATVSIDGIALGAPRALGSTGGWTTFQQDHIGTRVLHAGRHELRVDWGPGQSDLDRIEVTRETGQQGSVSDAPVSSVPGIVEAEDYAAFGDVDAGNRGRASTYADGVDVWPMIGGGYLVGRVVEEEYTSYQVTVTEADTYEFSIRHASGGARGGVATVSVDGTSIARPTALGNTNGWWRFATTPVGRTDLAVGTHTVRIDWGPGQSNFDYLKIEPAGPAVLGVSTELIGIDFDGRVTDASGGGVATVQVDLFEAVDEFTRGPFIQSGATADDGRFSFESLPTACYIVVVVAPGDARFSTGAQWHEEHACTAPINGVVCVGPHVVNARYDHVGLRANAGEDPRDHSTIAGRWVEAGTVVTVTGSSGIWRFVENATTTSGVGSGWAEADRLDPQPGVDCDDDGPIGGVVLEVLNPDGVVIYDLSESLDSLPLEDLRSLPISEVKSLRIRDDDDIVGGIDLETAAVSALREDLDASQYLDRVLASAAGLSAGNERGSVRPTGSGAAVFSQEESDPVAEATEVAALLADDTRASVTSAALDSLDQQANRGSFTLADNITINAAAEIEIDATGSYPISIAIDGQHDDMVVVGDALISGAENEDHRILIQPNDFGGTRIAVSIDRATAPSEYEFTFDASSGDRLEAGDDGSVRVLTADDKTTAVIAPPWAVDASGDTVPTNYEIRGTTLIQHVDHAGADYPVVADPEVIVTAAAEAYLYLTPGETAKLATYGLTRARSFWCAVALPPPHGLCDSHPSIQRDLLDRAKVAARQKGCIELFFFVAPDGDALLSTVDGRSLHDYRCSQINTVDNAVDFLQPSTMSQSNGSAGLGSLVSALGNGAHLADRFIGDVNVSAAQALTSLVDSSLDVANQVPDPNSIIASAATHLAVSRLAYEYLLDTDLVNTFIGCGSAVLEELIGLWDTFVLAARLNAGPAEQAVVLAEFVDMILAVDARIEEVGVGQFMLEVGQDLVSYDLLVTGEEAQWAGKIVCQIAIVVIAAYLSGGAAVLTKISRLIDKLRLPKSLQNRLKNKFGDRDVDLCDSFPAGTLVLMGDDDYQPIETIEPADRVTTYDPTTGVWSQQVVLAQWSATKDTAMATIYLAGDGQITSTDDHRFWVDSEGQWVEADEVEPGDLLLGPSGVARVSGVVVSDIARQTVWELDTAANHNFVVSTGDADVLVHNGCWAGRSPSNYTHGRSDGGPGEWGTPKSTPTRGVAYQEQVTGAPPRTEYKVKKRDSDEYRDFDGYSADRDVLIDAKDNYDWAINDDGTFKDGIDMDDQWLKKASGQVADADGTPVEWVMSQEKSAAAAENLFEENGIPVTVHHVPKE